MKIIINASEIPWNSGKRYAAILFNTERVCAEYQNKQPKKQVIESEIKNQFIQLISKAEVEFR